MSHPVLHYFQTKVYMPQIPILDQNQHLEQVVINLKL